MDLSAQDTDKAEMDSLVGWMERRMDCVTRGALRNYMDQFKYMWIKQFGTLDNVPKELISEINSRYIQLGRGLIPNE
jgi:hypothetical protein